MTDLRSGFIARLMSCFALILMTMALSEAMAQESPPGFDELVSDGYQWDAKEGVFLTREEKRVTIGDFAGLIGAEPGGVVDHMGIKYPWLLLDKSPWMLRSGTALQFCPECYGWTVSWNASLRMFESAGPAEFSASYANSMLEGKVRGMYKYGEGEYPWVELGDAQWVVGPNGQLHHCSTCDGTGNPGPVPPWVGGPNGPEVVVVSGSGADDGSFIVHSSGNVYTSCKALYYYDRVRSPWDECKK